MTKYYGAYEYYPYGHPLCKPQSHCGWERFRDHVSQVNYNADFLMALAEQFGSSKSPLAIHHGPAFYSIECDSLEQIDPLSGYHEWMKLDDRAYTGKMQKVIEADWRSILICSGNFIDRDGLPKYVINEQRNIGRYSDLIQRKQLKYQFHQKLQAPGGVVVPSFISLPVSLQEIEQIVADDGKMQLEELNNSPHISHLVHFRG